MVSLHIEPTSRCRLACPRCERTVLRSKGKKFLPITDLNISALEKFIDIPVEKITLCGNLGDPIYHSRFLLLIKMLKNKTNEISITTNGSGKNRKWWQELNKNLRSTDTIQFSIDGLPNNFMTYRINADWESIQIGIDECTKGPAKTTWKYIVFKYNEGDVEAAKDLSKELGFDKFRLEFSSRWEKNDFLRPDAVKEDTLAKLKYKDGDRDFTIDPKCSTNTEHYISSDGFYAPCCWSKHFNFYYKSKWWNNKEQHNIETSTLSEQCRHFDNFYSTIQTERYEYCVYNCGRC